MLGGCVVCSMAECHKEKDNIFAYLNEFATILQSVALKKATLECSLGDRQSWSRRGTAVSELQWTDFSHT